MFACFAVISWSKVQVILAKQTKKAKNIKKHKNNSPELSEWAVTFTRVSEICVFVVFHAALSARVFSRGEQSAASGLVAFC